MEGTELYKWKEQSLRNLPIKENIAKIDLCHEIGGEITLGDVKHCIQLAGFNFWELMSEKTRFSSKSKQKRRKALEKKTKTKRYFDEIEGRILEYEENQRYFNEIEGEKGFNDVRRKLNFLI